MIKKPEIFITSIKGKSEKITFNHAFKEGMITGAKDIIKLMKSSFTDEKEFNNIAKKIKDDINQSFENQFKKDDKIMCINGETFKYGIYLGESIAMHIIISIPKFDISKLKPIA